MRRKAVFALLMSLLIAGVTSSSLFAQTNFTLLHSFAGGNDGGENPQGSLISAGTTLYGMTCEGGDSGNGTVFSLRNDGTEFTLLHKFDESSDDGGSPYGSLIADGSKLYGMSYFGGSSGVGTVFSIQTSGSAFNLLHSFAGGSDDGENPYGSLLLNGGSLYGMTYIGGIDQGTIFSIGQDGSAFTLLHEFIGGNDDGSSPEGNDFIIDGSTLYSMTPEGGPSNDGTIFSTRTDGTDYTLLHRFSGGSDDGARPKGGLILAAGTLYGMTSSGGSSDYGTIFSIQDDGTGFTLLHSFSGQTDDGRHPEGNLIMNAGRLYGLTAYGGGSPEGKGTIFSILSDGTGFTLLHRFSQTGVEGINPKGSLIMVGSKLYGMAPFGGSNYGTIFSIQLPPPSLPWITDFNGDGISDIAIFRESSGLWAVRGITRVYFGSSSDEACPGDYDGDGTTDVGIFRGSSGLWALRGISRIYFGGADDDPIPADYDGDGISDPAIFRPASGLWAARGISRAYFGGSLDEPIPGYYSGMGQASIAIYRPSSGLWAFRGVTRIYFGTSTDDPVPGDYDGDGAWRPGIFRESSGLWALVDVTRAYFGGATDWPIPGEYSGDGTDDIGIFRESSGLWAIRGVTRVYFGGSGDVPVTR